MPDAVGDLPFPSLLRREASSKYHLCSADPELQPTDSVRSGQQPHVGELPCSTEGADLSTSARSNRPDRDGWHADLLAGSALPPRRVPTYHHPTAAPPRD